MLPIFTFLSKLEVWMQSVDTFQLSYRLLTFTFLEDVVHVPEVQFGVTFDIILELAKPPISKMGGAGDCPWLDRLSASRNRHEWTSTHHKRLS